MEGIIYLFSVCAKFLNFIQYSYIYVMEMCGASNKEIIMRGEQTWHNVNINIISHTSTQIHKLKYGYGLESEGQRDICS